MVKAYLKHIIERRLRNGVPGLLMVINMRSCSKTGMYASDLFVTHPLKFVELLKEYFGGNRKLAVNVLRHILKPLIDNHEECKEALKHLLDGDEETFLNIVLRVLEKDAKKWYRGR